METFGRSAFRPNQFVRIGSTIRSLYDWILADVIVSIEGRSSPTLYFLYWRCQTSSPTVAPDSMRTFTSSAYGTVIRQFMANLTRCMSRIAAP